VASDAERGQPEEQVGLGLLVAGDVMAPSTIAARPLVDPVRSREGKKYRRCSRTCVLGRPDGLR
jgi:hypothetical protein